MHNIRHAYSSINQHFRIYRFIEKESINRKDLLKISIFFECNIITIENRILFYIHTYFGSIFRSSQQNLQKRYFLIIKMEKQ